MTKKLYLPLLMAMVVALFSSCSKKMGELSADYFTVTPQVLEAVGGKVPATINGKFPEKYFNKKAVVEVTPVLKWNGGEAKGQPATFQGEKVEGNDQTISYKMGGSYTMKTSFDYVPEMAKSELYLEFKATIGKKVVTIPAVKVADGVISTSELVNNTLGNANPALGEDAFQLNKIFGATDNEVHRFEKLNALLLELTNQMYARTCLLYRNTLRYADYSWDDDYEVEGTLSCHPEYDKDDSNHHDILRLEEDNYYGSDFAYMAALICEYEEYYNGSFGENIEMCSIQHNSKNTPDMSDKQLECVNDLEDGTTWAEGWLCHPKLEHICMCHAVHSLVCHHAFSIPDMLRINDFWVEASIKVQHITDQTGKQWKDIDYDS